MPDDVVVILLYVAGAIALLAVVWRLSAARADAKVRQVRGDRPLGEERLKAYAAMVEVGMPPSVGLPPVGLPSVGLPEGPVPPPPPPSSSSSSFKTTLPPGGPFPDPHLLERVRALEAKVAALEAQVGAPAEADLSRMRAPRPEGAPQDAPRPAGLRAFP